MLRFGGRLIVEMGCKFFCRCHIYMCLCGLSLVVSNEILVDPRVVCGICLRLQTNFSCLRRLIVLREAQNLMDVGHRRSLRLSRVVAFLENGCDRSQANVDNVEGLADSLWSYYLRRLCLRQCAWSKLDQNVRRNAV